MLARAPWRGRHTTAGSSAQTPITELKQQLHPRGGGEKSYSLLSPASEKAIHPGGEEMSTGLWTWRTPSFQSRIADFSDQPHHRQPATVGASCLNPTYHNSQLPAGPEPPHLLCGPGEEEAICHSETLRADGAKNCNQRLRDPKMLRQEGLEETTRPPRGGNASSSHPFWLSHRFEMADVQTYRYLLVSVNYTNGLTCYRCQ